MIHRWGIHQKIDPRQWEAIIPTCLVQVLEIRAHPPFTFRHLDKYHIGKSIWIMGFSNEASLE
jgi:hypothetical protein